MKIKVKRQRGYSIILVASLGAIALLGALALSSTLMPFQRDFSSLSINEQACSAAENAMQYAVNYIDSAWIAGNIATVPSNLTVPSSICGGATVSVSISKINGLTGIRYDTSAQSNLTQSVIYSVPQSGAPPLYFQVTVQSTYGRFIRTLCCVLGSVPNGGAGPIHIFRLPSVPGVSPLSPYFNAALTANSSLSVANNISLLTENAVQSTNVYTNGTVSLGGANVIDGNLSAYAFLPGATTISASSAAVINGNLATNGTVQSTIPLGQGQTVFSSDGSPDLLNTYNKQGNVLANGVVDTNFGTISTSASQTATNSISPVSATEEAPALQTGSNATTVNPPVQANAPVYNLGAINLSGNQTLTLGPGQYTVSSINVADNAQMITNVPVGSPYGVSLFVEGATASPNGIVNIGGNGVIQTGSTAASNLQVFYSGTESVNVQLSSNFPKFYGLIYAPNATVTVNTSTGQFHGAAVGNDLAITGNGTVYFDPASISTTGSANGAAGPSFTTFTPGQSNPSGITSLPTLPVLSWQEY